MTTEIEVIDTAVKVGLGAFIAGVTSYVIAIINHKKETSRILASESVALLKKCAFKIEEGTALTNNACQNIGLLISKIACEATLETELIKYIEAINKNREAKTYSQILGAEKLTSLIEELQDKYDEEFQYLKNNGLDCDVLIINSLGHEQGEIRTKIGLIYGEIFKNIYT